MPNIPRMEIAQQKFLLLHADELGENATELKEKLLEYIKDDNMAPFYSELCAELGWDVDQDWLEVMQKANAEQSEKLNAAILDAEKNLGESEMRDLMVTKAELYCRTGDREKALSMFHDAYQRTVALGHRLDIVFNIIRIGLFYGDSDLTVKNIAKAKGLIEEGGDWDRRNRLKVYEGTYLLSIRSFKEAAQLFLEALATFTSYELMAYDDFVTATALAAVLTLDRVTLGKKVINSPEVLAVAHERPIVGTYLKSLYDCNYAEFFRALAEIEQMMKRNRYLNPHYRYYVREMRIVAYKQLLDSYQSVTVDSLALTFGVTPAFLDRELSRFIAAGRLSCKVDKVAGIVETLRNDVRSVQYQRVIKNGDLLLNRIQKLSRVINI